MADVSRLKGDESYPVADLEFRKGGSAMGAQSTPKSFWIATPTSGTLMHS